MHNFEKNPGFCDRRNDDKDNIMALKSWIAALINFVQTAQNQFFYRVLRGFPVYDVVCSHLMTCGRNDVELTD